MADATYAVEALVTLCLGLLVGAVELVSRYRDNPRDAVRTAPAVFYLLINGLAAVLALYLTYAFSAFTGTDSKVEVLRVFTAGLGSMAFFRTGLFTVRVGEQDLAVGPGSFLQLLLAAIDREVDRVRAQSRATAARQIMAGVSFERAHTALPTFCLSLMQNLPAEDQTSLGEQVNALRGATTIPEDTKSLVLGVTLMNFVGQEVVRVAVDNLGPSIRSANGVSWTPASSSSAASVVAASERA